MKGSINMKVSVYICDSCQTQIRKEDVRKIKRLKKTIDIDEVEVATDIELCLDCYIVVKSIFEEVESDD